MVVGYLSGSVAVSLMSIPLMIAMTISPFILVIVNQISPLASRMDARGEIEQLRRLATTSSEYTLTLALLPFLAVIFLGREGLEFWLGGEKVSSSDIDEISVILAMFMGAYLIYLQGRNGRDILLSIGKHWNATYGEVFTASMGLGLGTALMLLVERDAKMMVIGLGAALILRGAVIYPAMTARHLGIAYLKLMTKSCGRPLLATLLALFVGLVVQAVLDGQYSRAIVNLLAGAIAELVFMVVALFWIMDRGHRDILFRKISRLRTNSLN